jgi:H+/Cl- antiporter ClcA
MGPKGDFTAGRRLLGISALAVATGAACAGVAVVLLWLIGLFTNLFYYHTFSGQLRPPAESPLGWWAALVPVVGGLIIGLMARYGSERIRGHGIPEALEAILIGKSRMSPLVAVLKPFSSAISIGSGGPFGAEGPIIMTGGACGSLTAQTFHLTAAERKTLLVAGAAAGMAATFATPVAAVLLAVELLLFEWKPRSLVPVALASATAALLRPFLLGGGPLFTLVPHARLGATALLGAAGLGLIEGAVALALTLAVYAAEDGFHRLKFHWMWWPALGGVIVGVGGLFEPRALGVGYDIIEDLLRGDLAIKVLLPLLVVKAVIWAGALGSGTSGGVLAPLLIIGGGVGAVAAAILPGGDPTLWALVGMAAVLGGTMRAPLTGAVFGLELTNDVNALPALMLASIGAYGFTVLMMRRSILTEKLARRGYHVSREYAVDPLERLSVAEVMTGDVVSVSAGLPAVELLREFFLAGADRKHQGYPVVDTTGVLLGVVTRSDLLEEWRAGKGGPDAPVVAYDLIRRAPVSARPWESCRTAAERMAREGVGRLPVVADDGSGKIVGVVTRSDLLKPRGTLAEEEQVRERFLTLGRSTPTGPRNPARPRQ